MYKNDVGTQKIDVSKLEINELVIAFFRINDINKKYRFFKKPFLPADISMNIAFTMPFLTLSNVKINFNNREFK